MKFGQELKFNAVPEWKDFYIRYGLFKKLIFEEEERHSRGNGEAEARRSLGELRLIECGAAAPLVHCVYEAKALHTQHCMRTITGS